MKYRLQFIFSGVRQESLVIEEYKKQTLREGKEKDYTKESAFHGLKYCSINGKFAHIKSVFQ